MFRDSYRRRHDRFRNGPAATGDVGTDPLESTTVAIESRSIAFETARITVETSYLATEAARLATGEPRGESA